MMLRIVPLPISIMIPVIPLMLSTQPGKGSFQAPVTIEGRTIPIGTLPAISLIKLSAIAFVSV